MNFGGDVVTNDLISDDQCSSVKTSSSMPSLRIKCVSSNVRAFCSSPLRTRVSRSKNFGLQYDFFKKCSCFLEKL